VPCHVWNWGAAAAGGAALAAAASPLLTSPSPLPVPSQEPPADCEMCLQAEAGGEWLYDSGGRLLPNTGPSAITDRGTGADVDVAAEQGQAQAREEATQEPDWYAEARDDIAARLEVLAGTSPAIPRGVQPWGRLHEYQAPPDGSGQHRWVSQQPTLADGDGCVAESRTCRIQDSAATPTAATAVVSEEAAAAAASALSSSPAAARQSHVPLSSSSVRDEGAHPQVTKLGHEGFAKAVSALNLTTSRPSDCQLESTSRPSGAEYDAQSEGKPVHRVAPLGTLAAAITNNQHSHEADAPVQGGHQIECEDHVCQSQLASISTPDASAGGWLWQGVKGGWVQLGSDECADQTVAIRLDADLVLVRPAVGRSYYWSTTTDETAWLEDVPQNKRQPQPRSDGVAVVWAHTEAQKKPPLPTATVAAPTATAASAAAPEQGSPCLPPNPFIAAKAAVLKPRSISPGGGRRRHPHEPLSLSCATANNPFATASSRLAAARVDPHSEWQAKSPMHSMPRRCTGNPFAREVAAILTAARVATRCCVPLCLADPSAAAVSAITKLGLDPSINLISTAGPPAVSLVVSPSRRQPRQPTFSVARAWGQFLGMAACESAHDVEMERRAEEGVPSEDEDSDDCRREEDPGRRADHHQCKLDLTNAVPRYATVGARVAMESLETAIECHQLQEVERQIAALRCELGLPMESCLDEYREVW
jgi:hypothetical protein